MHVNVFIPEFGTIPFLNTYLIFSSASWKESGKFNFPLITLSPGLYFWTYCRRYIPRNSSCFFPIKLVRMLTYFPFFLYWLQYIDTMFYIDKNKDIDFELCPGSHNGFLALRGFEEGGTVWPYFYLL